MYSSHLSFQPFLLFSSFSRPAFLLLPFPLLSLLCSFHLSLKRFLLLGRTRRSVTLLPVVLSRTAWISYQLFFFLLPLQVLNLLPALGSPPRSGLHSFRETGEVSVLFVFQTRSSGVDAACGCIDRHVLYAAHAAESHSQSTCS